MMSEITRTAIQAPLAVAMASEMSRSQFHALAQDLLRDFDRVTAENAALQQRLNAADQQIDDQAKERESLIAYGRSLGLDEASTLCSRMAYDEYYPAGSRFRFFTPKAQEKLGNLLIKAANAIANLPDGPYERFKARQQKKANGSANMIDHDHVVGTTEKVAQPFTEQFLEDHLGKMPDQLRDHTKMIAERNPDPDFSLIGIVHTPPVEHDEP